MTIVHNLLSNAIKFSPDDGVIRVTLAQDAERVILDVVDQGLGIAQQDAKQIFEPFYRSAASRHVVGIGLGLAIAREFVLAHRGDLLLIATSVGAHFRVVLPLAAPHLRVEPDV